MTTTDYLLNIGLIGLVILQIRGRRLTLRSLLLPVVITVWVAAQFLHGLPTAGNDVILEAAGGLLGGLLGVGAGLATSVHRDGQGALAKAGFLAAILWVVGIGARLGFSLWVTHGGRGSVAHFSTQVHITSGAAWTAAFILMAITEVVSRTAVLYLKARQAGGRIERRSPIGIPAA